jgi:hypothetical protein
LTSIQVDVPVQPLAMVHDWVSPRLQTKWASAGPGITSHTQSNQTAVRTQRCIHAPPRGAHDFERRTNVLML